MVLLPSLILVIGALVLLPARGRSARLVPGIVSVLSALVVLLLGRQVPVTLTISIWRPAELFGPGLAFNLSSATWPLLLLGAAVVLSDTVLSRGEPSTLLMAGAGLAAIVAGNLLSVVIAWTVMITIQAAIELRTGKGVEGVLRRLATQAIALIALMSAAAFRGVAALLLGLGALLRAGGGSANRRPLTLSTMAALAALAALNHASIDPDPSVALALLGGTALVVALIGSIAEPSSARPIGLAATGTATLMAGLYPQAATSFAVAGGVSVVLAMGILALGIGRFRWVAVLPIAGLIPGGLEILFPLTVAAALFAAVLWTQDAESQDRLSPPEVGALLVILIAAVGALLSSEWRLNIGGAVGTAFGIGLGYTLSRALATVQFRQRNLLDSTGRLGRSTIAGVALVIRTATGILEGRSAVLWILLALLLALIGLQSLAA